MVRAYRATFRFLSIFLLLGFSSHAQERKGSISGHATDTNHDPLVGARVELQPVGRTAATDAQGQFTRLWDAGYQKFLLTDEGLKLPALATHLQNLRKFNEELRTALGVPTFYNEALGSVSQVSVYDRVKGRKGDVPDETVGAHVVGDGGH